MTTAIKTIRNQHGSFALLQTPNQWILGYLDGRKDRIRKFKPSLSGERAYLLGYWSGYRDHS